MNVDSTSMLNVWGCVCVCVKDREVFTFFLIQHSEWLHQLMFSTLHHSQSSLAFFLKRSEQTKKKRSQLQPRGHVQTPLFTLKNTQTGVKKVTLWYNNYHLKLNQQKLYGMKQWVRKGNISRNITFVLRVIHHCPHRNYEGEFKLFNVKLNWGKNNGPQSERHGIEAPLDVAEQHPG